MEVVIHGTGNLGELPVPFFTIPCELEFNMVDTNELLTKKTICSLK